ncbi:MAG: helix-turn-helix transcriptional regulator [Rhodanobacteraceae bacterium]|nr:helix-turn-helix transcriptional regulator [Rhodanobacteraceae bacterium]
MTLHIRDATIAALGGWQSGQQLMDSLVTLFQFAAIAVALSWLLWLLVTPHKTRLHLAWAVFCGSLCLVLTSAATAESLGIYRYLVGIGTCATCNVFWLVSRALFRSGQPFHTRHVLFVAAMSGPIALGQFAQLASARDLLGDLVYRFAIGGISGWTQLLGAGFMLLAFWEGVRKPNHELPVAEQRLRRNFLWMYGVCALASTLWTNPSQDPMSPLAKVGPLLDAISALTLLLVTGHAVRFRTRHPLADEVVGSSVEVERTADQDDLVLARRIEACVRGRQLYLEPELKVADLAELLGTPDYRISRAITLGLKQANFNRFINGYRIDHAKRLLSDQALRSRSILAIGIDSGFASVGPFNRAFKASTGQTPSAFRGDALNSPDVTA